MQNRVAGLESQDTVECRHPCAGVRHARDTTYARDRPADDPARHFPCQPAYTVTFATEASVTPRVPVLNHSVGTIVPFTASGRWKLNGPRRLPGWLCCTTVLIYA